jgi:hypothetical protein
MKPRNLILSSIGVGVLTIAIVFWHGSSDDSGDALANTPASHASKPGWSNPFTLAPQPPAGAPTAPPADEKPPVDMPIYRPGPQPSPRHRCDDASAENPRVGCGRDDGPAR